MFSPDHLIPSPAAYRVDSAIPIIFPIARVFRRDPRVIPASGIGDADHISEFPVTKCHVVGNIRPCDPRRAPQPSAPFPRAGYTLHPHYGWLPRSNLYLARLAAEWGR
jgi:hypothetical protein